MRSLRLFVALAASSPLLLATPLTVGELRTDYSVNPTDIDLAAPLLSWRVSSPEAGARQASWRLLVASSEELLARDVGDLWDSGQVSTGSTQAIPYAGKPLASFARAFWKVRSWNSAGEASDWSPAATWSMGVLQPGDWRATWIAAPASTESLLLRGDFRVRPGLTRALAYACGLGNYELRLNGRRVGNDLLAPGWTNYDETTLYDTHDVTALLRAGDNAAGLSVGNGMYHVQRRNRFAKFTRSFGPLRAILMLRLEYADGSTEFVGTGDGWRCRPGPAVYNSIYGGEDFDARLDPKGWDLPGFDASAWTPVVPVVRTGDTLRGHSFNSEPLRVIEVRQPASVKALPGRVFLYDLGQNASYMPRLRVTGPAGSTVRLIPSEVARADGTLVRTTMGGLHRGLSWWQYTKATDAEETWYPQFYYVGFRYLQAELYAPGEVPREAISSLALQKDSPAPAGVPAITALDGLVVHAAAAPTGEFSTSDPLLNRIRDLVRWAQRSNMVSVLTDCPHREKLGWIEQFHLNGPAIRYEFDVNRIFTKAMADMAAAQTDDGLIPNIAPEYADFKGAFKGAAEWGAAFLLVPLQQYEFTGDKTLLARHYGAMKRYFSYLESRCVDGILSDGLGDWYDVGPAKSGKSQHTPPPVTATAFLYDDARSLARIATLLGHAADAARYTARAEQIRARYNREFFKPAEGSYATGSQCANSLALVMGLVEPAHRDRVFQALVRDVEGRGCTVTAGDIGFRYLLRALADGGRSDLILRMITQDEKPGYAYQLKQGATALTESWDSNLGSSHNHFMLGQVTEWFYHDLLGIAPDPEKPGFEHVLLNPTPVGELSHVEGSFDSVRGRISVRWERREGRLHYRVTLPANTHATLTLPCREGATLLWDGKPLPDTGTGTAPRRLGRQAGREVLSLPAGTHSFEIAP